MSLSPLAILGAGNMASALALHLAKQKRPIRLYCIEPNVHQEMCTTRCNSTYLPGYSFPNNVKTSPDLKQVLQDASIVWIVVPSSAIEAVIQQALPFLSPKAILVNASKGLDQKTGLPFIEKISSTLPKALKKSICVLGGPAIANELAQGSPTGFILGSHDQQAARSVAQLLQSSHVKVAITSDRIGVGLCSALKHIYAIGLGVCDGLHYPTNAKALITTIAIQEMAEVITSMGGLHETAYGLAGLGDVIVSGMSPHGRNRAFGERWAQTTTYDHHMATQGLTVEGIVAAKAITQLLKQHKIHAPLLKTIIRVISAKQHPTKPFEHYVKTLRLTP